jgi:hypothetical protein
LIAQASLFPQPPESDTDRAHRVDVMVLDAICGRLPYQVSERQRQMLHILRSRRGLARAIPIDELAKRLLISPRQIKEEIADLTVRFRIPIGSSRDPATAGYYLTMTHQECIDSAAPHIHQALAHFRRAQVLLDAHDLNELLGQYSLNLKGESL